MTHEFAGPARIGVAADLLLTALLTAFLLLMTNDHLDALPRPIVLAALLATPAVIAGIGIVRRRRSLLMAAALPLIPASVLSWGLVTLPYAGVALLFVAGATSPSLAAETRALQAIHATQAALVALLVLAAGWVVLFGATVNTCVSDPGASACGSGVITNAGVVAGALLLGSAIALAALGRRPPAQS